MRDETIKEGENGDVRTERQTDARTAAEIPGYKSDQGLLHPKVLTKARDARPWRGREEKAKVITTKIKLEHQRPTVTEQDRERPDTWKKEVNDIKAKMKVK